MCDFAGFFLGADRSRLYRFFFLIEPMSSISIWFGRVPTDWNCADAPPIGLGLPFEVNRDCAFDTHTDRLTIQNSLFADKYDQIRNGRQAARSIPLTREPAIDSTMRDAEDA